MTAEEIGTINAEQAFDQQAAYPSLEKAIIAFEANTIDTAHEQKVSVDEALSFFYAAVDALR